MAVTMNQVTLFAIFVAWLPVAVYSLQYIATKYAPHLSTESATGMENGEWKFDPEDFDGST